MLWRDIGYLCKAVKKLDAMRRPTKTEYEKGIKRNEFYQAQTAGYKPELCVEIKASEYHKEEYFEYGGDMYRILRSYPTKAENLEIICTALVNENV